MLNFILHSTVFGILTRKHGVRGNDDGRVYGKNKFMAK